MAHVFLFVFQGILEDPGILYQKNAILYAKMAMEEIQDVYIDVYAITLYSLWIKLNNMQLTLHPQHQNNETSSFYCVACKKLLTWFFLWKKTN